jgi:hypothetical protein
MRTTIVQFQYQYRHFLDMAGLPLRAVSIAEPPR